MRFEIYEEYSVLYSGKSNQWRWRFVARNGKIMADSGEAYASASNARRAVHRFIALVCLTEAEIVTLDA